MARRGLPALIAELDPGGEFCAATGAGRGEAGAALEAEARLRWVLVLAPEARHAGVTTDARAFPAFLDANVSFTAAYSPDGLSALRVELGAAGRLTLLTSPLAIVEAERNLEAKRPAALPTLRGSLTAARVVRAGGAVPSPPEGERARVGAHELKDTFVNRSD